MIKREAAGLFFFFFLRAVDVTALAALTSPNPTHQALGPHPKAKYGHRIPTRFGLAVSNEQKPNRNKETPN